MASSCDAGYSNTSRPSSQLCPAAHKNRSRWATQGRHMIFIAFTESGIVYTFSHSRIQYLLLGLLQSSTADINVNAQDLAKL